MVISVLSRAKTKPAGLERHRGQIAFAIADGLRPVEQTHRRAFDRISG
jgi:hypothetical protein